MFDQRCIRDSKSSVYAGEKTAICAHVLYICLKVYIWYQSMYNGRVEIVLCAVCFKFLEPRGCMQFGDCI